ncbi:MAG: DUF6152 family protein [Candidatus Acidiferrales bacterium]|jgi:hypothetical protein
MKSATFAAVAAGAVWLMAAVPTLAHHSFAAEFDLEKPVTLHGTAVKWEMINPHGYITLDVKNDDGSVTRWSVEMGAPSTLYRNGWRKDSVKAGDELTISGFRARDGSNTMFGSQAKLADGRRVLGGAPRPAPETQPQDSLPPDKQPNQ